MCQRVVPVPVAVGLAVAREKWRLSSEKKRAGDGGREENDQGSFAREGDKCWRLGVFSE